MIKFNKQLDKLGTETAFSVSAEARLWEDKGNKVYPFHLGDLNFQTPINIREKTVFYMNKNKNGYCPSEGIFALREALAHDVGIKRGVEYDPDNVAVQPGGKPTIGKFISSIMNPGDEILYPNPGYPIYESQIEYQGGKAVPYSFVQTDLGFDIDLQKLEDSISDRTVALIYNNYQNPISAESSKVEMQSIADIAIENDLWVLSDEAYFEIVYDGQAESIVSIPGMVDRTVILYTFSKKFAMTGWRVGGSIGPKEIIKRIAKFNVNAESCTTHFIQNAMVEALNGDQTGSQKILEELKARRDVAVKGLNAIDGIDIAAPRTTFYLFPNVNNIMARKGLNRTEDLQDGALAHANVSFCTRDHFGRPHPDEEDYYIRLAYSGISVDDINEGLIKLKDYFESQ